MNTAINLGHTDALSRRSFLTGASLVAAGAAAVAVAPKLAHADEAVAATSTEKQIFDGQTLAKGHIVHDPDLCAGCRVCEIVCSLSHWGIMNTEKSNIRIRTDILGGYISEAEICRQCAGAECVAVCPTGALAADPNTGARVIDAAKCVGCQLCVKACPARPSNIRYIATHNVCGKCDLCGGEPLCVAHCPAAALAPSWVAAASDANIYTTSTGISVRLDLTGAILVIAPDAVTVTGVDTAKSGSGVSVTATITSTYTQPFEAKVKVTYFNAAGEPIYAADRFVVEMGLDDTQVFEDVFETDAPNDVASINLEVMCGKISG